MKKVLRKFVSVMLVLSMVLGGAAFAFADEGDSAVSAAAKEPTVKDGYNVMIDGDYVSFTDAVPQNINGRIMVPFRAIFEAMDAKVDYDHATRTVSADKGDIHISFVIGSKEITVTKGSEVYKKTMDVAAFIDKSTSRTFVPTRFVAEALDYTVGWDNAEKTAIVVDTDSIFANIDEDFSILNKILTSSQNTDAAKTYKTTGDIKLALDVKGLTEADDVSLAMSAGIDALTKGMDAEMNMDASFDFGDMYKDADAEEAAMVEALKDVDIDVVMDAESGDLWFKCQALNSFAGVTGDNVWFKMNAYDLYDSMGIDLRSLAAGAESGTMTLSDVADMLVDEDMTVDSYDIINGMYALAKAAFGDDAFKVSKSGSVTTYTLKVDQSTLAKFFTDLGMTSAEAAEVLSTAGITAFNVQGTAKEKAGAVTEFAFKGDMAANGTAVSFDVASSATSEKLAMTVDVASMMKMSIEASAAIKESSDKVDTTLPTGATVIDLMEALSSSK